MSVDKDVVSFMALTFTDLEKLGKVPPQAVSSAGTFSENFNVNQFK
jgi:hypothetical protein